MPVYNLTIFSENVHPNWDGTHDGLWNTAATTASIGSSSTLSILDDDLLLSDHLVSNTNGTVVDTTQQVIDGTTTTVNSILHIDVINVTTGESGKAFLLTIDQEISGALGWVFTIPVSAGDQIDWQPTINVGDSDSYAYGEVSYADIQTVCFVSGTLIKTQNGKVAIEDLTKGDMVLTMDRSYQPIRWIGCREMDAIDLRAAPNLRPIRIAAGAMGEGKPEQDLTLSPQHRVLLSSKIVERIFGEQEILVPVKKLLGTEGIEVVDGEDGCAYYHMLFDQHEVVYANGLPSESLYLGSQALKSVSHEARREIEALFPEVLQDGFIQAAARPFHANKKIVGNLLARHQKNNRPLLCAHV